MEVDDGCAGTKSYGVLYVTVIIILIIMRHL